MLKVEGASARKVRRESLPLLSVCFSKSRDRECIVKKSDGLLKQTAFREN